MTSSIRILTDLVGEKMASMEKLYSAYDGAVAPVDPHAGRVVGSHYTLSHYCAALYMLGWLREDVQLIKKAENIFRFVEKTHAVFVKEKDYHHDFNNFAWAVLLEADQKAGGRLAQRTRQKFIDQLLSVRDSKHETVNWLPMRAFNNAVRGKVSGKSAYQRKKERILARILKAQTSDGYFLDLIGRNESASPQYHLYTLVVLLLGADAGFWNHREDMELGAIEVVSSHIDPDGDFNYYGRGTNQLFGWGPMMFIISCMPAPSRDFERCQRYFSSHLPECLAVDGLLLENTLKRQHSFWRYYHYPSVYYAHLFFWLVLAQTFRVSLPARAGGTKTVDRIRTLSNDKGFVAVFHGAGTYLVERGPSVCNVWTRRHGALFKGPFGPLGEMTDREEGPPSKVSVMCNYMGPIIDRISGGQAVLFPGFHGIDLKRGEGDDLVIEYRRERIRADEQFNLPVFSRLNLSEDSVNELFELRAGHQRLRLHHYGRCHGPYHELDLFRSGPLGLSRTLQLLLKG